MQFEATNITVNESATTATLTVTRAGSTGTTTVNYATGDATATAGSDYLAASGTITFNEGETSKTFTVQIINDAEAEANETFNVTLSGVSSDAVLGSLSTATVTILDDDSPVFVSLNDISINEADAGTSLAVFTVSLSRRNITRLRFRVIEISTLGASGAERFADVRVLSSTGNQSAGQSVFGLTLEPPSMQPPGGGLNSSLRVDAVTTATPLAAGGRIEVEFRFDIMRAGQFKFVVIAEALP